VIPLGITGVGVAHPRVLDNTHGQPVIPLGITGVLGIENFTTKFL